MISPVRYTPGAKAPDLRNKHWTVLKTWHKTRAPMRTVALCGARVMFPDERDTLPSGARLCRHCRERS